MISHKFGIFILGLGLIAGSARATTTFNTALAFDNAVAADTGLTLAPTITFTDDADATLLTTFTDTGSDVTFTSADMNVENETADGWSGGNLIRAGTGAGSISIAPASAYYAFGFSIVTVSGGAYPMSVTFNDGAAEDFSVTASSTNGTAIFFGVISTAPITGLEVSTASEGMTFGIDNVQTAATPEGSTNLLIGSGLIGLTFLHRRRRRPFQA